MTKTTQSGCRLPPPPPDWPPLLARGAGTQGPAWLTAWTRRVSPAIATGRWSDWGWARLDPPHAATLWTHAVGTTSISRGPGGLWSTCQQRGQQHWRVHYGTSPGEPGARPCPVSRGLACSREKRCRGPTQCNTPCAKQWGRDMAPEFTRQTLPPPGGQDGHLSRACEDTTAEGPNSRFRRQESGCGSHRAAKAGRGGGQGGPRGRKPSYLP